MRYDDKTGKIKISLSELVTIARRGISPTLPCDEDEPKTDSLKSQKLRRLIPDLESSDLHYGFDCDGFSFEMSATADGVGGNAVTVAREITSSPKKPRREEERQVRGEAYVISHVLSELCGYSEILLNILYLNSFTGEYNTVTERVSKAKLSVFFEKCKRAVGKYAAPEIHRVTKRLPSMKNMSFPYDTVREGQNEFIKSAYRALARGTSLFASAPTGTGKTVSVIYPALKALANGKCDKVFYLTPKSTTAEAVRDCLELIASAGTEVRALILTAKEKACEAALICKREPNGCPMAKCNALQDGALELFNMGKTVITAKEAQDVSRKLQICPYELLLTYAELCDVVVCDFNHALDPRAYIRRFFDDGGRYALLIDESHNLVDRSREMFSAEISDADIGSPALSDALPEFSAIRTISGEARDVFLNLTYPLIKDELRKDRDEHTVGAICLSTVPERLYSLAEELTGAAENEMYRLLAARDGVSEAAKSAIKKYYYDLKRFNDTLARFDDCYRMLLFYTDGSITLKLFCLNSAPEIKKTLDKCHGAVFFSATLSPLEYYRAVLGGDRSDETLEVQSPFDSSQLSVSIVNSVSTRFSERDDTLGAICRYIAATLSAKRGHYMIFSPSFRYSEVISRYFQAKYPKIKVIVQKQNMTQGEREKFIENFKREESSYLAAFCVMGGIYSEGLDLAGDSLIGAIIVGIGMPSLSFEREAIAEYYEEKYEMGKSYAYLYPGMNRVFQAAGRVIRREGDRGVIVMIDDRFSDPIYKKSMPKLWKNFKFIQDPKSLRLKLDDFWAENDK